MSRKGNTWSSWVLFSREKNGFKKHYWGEWETQTVGYKIDSMMYLLYNIRNTSQLLF